MAIGIPYPRIKQGEHANNNEYSNNDKNYMACIFLHASSIHRPDTAFAI